MEVEGPLLLSIDVNMSFLLVGAMMIYIYKYIYSLEVAVTIIMHSNAVMKVFKPISISVTACLLICDNNIDDETSAWNTNQKQRQENGKE